MTRWRLALPVLACAVLVVGLHLGLVYYGVTYYMTQIIVSAYYALVVGGPVPAHGLRGPGVTGPCRLLRHRRLHLGRTDHLQSQRLGPEPLGTSPAESRTAGPVAGPLRS